VPGCEVSNSGQKPGVVVMTTNFCDFCQFSGKKLAFFSKNNVTMKLLQNLAVVSAKKPPFCREIFRRKYF
jgi:hypothetical protein